MVIMCLLTTFMTCPLILWIYPSSVRVNYIAHTDELNDQNHDHEISHKVHYEDETKSASIRMVEVNKDLISTSKIEETKYDNDVVGEGA